MSLWIDSSAARGPLMTGMVISRESVRIVGSDVLISRGIRFNQSHREIEELTSPLFVNVKRRHIFSPFTARNFLADAVELRRASFEESYPSAADSFQEALQTLRAVAGGELGESSLRDARSQILLRSDIPSVYTNPYLFALGADIDRALKLVPDAILKAVWQETDIEGDGLHFPEATQDAMQDEMNAMADLFDDWIKRK